MNDGQKSNTSVLVWVLAGLGCFVVVSLLALVGLAFIGGVGAFWSLQSAEEQRYEVELEARQAERELEELRAGEEAERAAQEAAAAQEARRAAEERERAIREQRDTERRAADPNDPLDGLEGL